VHGSRVGNLTEAGCISTTDEARVADVLVSGSLAYKKMKRSNVESGAG
jgi:hypothetical protein